MPSIANSNPATKQEIRDVAAMTVFADFAANDGTPSVAAGGSFKTNNNLATTITDFVGGYNGQRITVVIDDAFTTVDFSGTNLIGNGGIDWSPSVGDSLFAVRDNAGSWFCIISTITGTGSYIAKNSTDTSTGKLTIEGVTASTYQLAGINNSTTSGSIGIQGESASISGVGIYGTTSGSSSRAVRGITNGSGSRGGEFQNTLNTGINYGVYAYVASSAGFAGYFLNNTDQANVSLSSGVDFISCKLNTTEYFKVDKTGKIFASGGINNLAHLTGVINVTGTTPASGTVLYAINDSYAIWKPLVESDISDLGDYATNADLALKADITYVDTEDALKADITYVDSENIAQDVITAAHAADTTIHFLQSEISITESQISDLRTNNWLAANNGIDFDNAPVAATGAIAAGDLAEAAAENGIAFGNGAYADNQGDIALGYNAITQSDFTGVNPPHNIAIGPDTQSLGDEGSLVLGDTSIASATEAMAIGRYCDARGIGSSVFGIGLSVDNDYAIKIGYEGQNVLSVDEGRIWLEYGTDTYNYYPTLYNDDLGATASTTFDLPAATKGMKYVFERASGYAYLINPQDTEYFAGSSAGLYKSLDAIGTYMSIECFKTGIWHVVASFGIITDE